MFTGDGLRGMRTNVCTRATSGIHIPIPMEDGLRGTRTKVCTRATSRIHTSIPMEGGLRGTQIKFVREPPLGSTLPYTLPVILGS